MDATLYRDGNRFRGIVEVFDGETSTTWSDYTAFLVEITDNNDIDGDGLPDLIALPEPTGATSLVTGLVGLIALSRARRREERGQ